jgi:hypothetical protein
MPLVDKSELANKLYRFKEKKIRHKRYSTTEDAVFKKFLLNDHP